MERVYSTMDKSEFGPGPWDDEPDKVQWKDEATGFACLAKRNHMGCWCGYVGVPPGHPYYECDYCEPGVSVHGDLTYADFCQEGPEETSICHVPDPGEPDKVWWFGFDCGHAYDFVPYMVAKCPEFADLRPCEYRTLEYVRQETTRLAAQLAYPE